jgi:hypothetical protein
LKEHIAKVELHFKGRGNHLVKKLRTDKGGEFENKDLQAYEVQKGIQHQFTVSRTPQQDGISEISNKIIIGPANSMLHASNAPKFLWPYAVKAATYITNLLPNKGTHEPGKTPYELWYGFKPSVAHLRVWGCLAYIHVHKDVRSGKLDKRAIPVIFVGYTDSTKIHEFYDPSNKKCYTSRDAVFYEDRRYPYKKKKQSSTKEHHSSEESDYPASYEESFPEGIRDEEDLYPFIYRPNPPPPVNDDKPNESDDDDDNSDDYKPDERQVRRPRMITELATNGQLPTADVNQPRQTRSSRPIPGGFDGNTSYAAIDDGDTSDDEGLIQDLRNPEDDDKCEITPELYSLLVNAGPATMSLALSGKNAQHWKSAIDDELGNLESHHTWNIVDVIPEKIKPITARMVLQEKINADGKISRYKARLVAHGFKQIYGQNYNVAYAPLVTLATIRMIFTYAAVKDLEIDQMDVVGAFLESNLKEEVYVTLPKGCISSDKKGITIDITSKEQVTVKLNKSIYGLKQSAFEWYDNIRGTLIDNGFQGTQHEAGLFYKYVEQRILIIMVWVDDLSIVGTRNDIDEFKRFISAKYTMKDLGPISDYLGMKILRDRTNKSIQLSQRAYIEKFLQRFGMSECHSAYTPMNEKYAELAIVNDNDELADKQNFQEAIGSLNYAAICTRPDIAFAVGFLGRFASKPTKKQRLAVNRVFQYLKHTKHYKLTLGGVNNDTDNDEGIVTYADASFANENYKSTSGIVIYYANSPVLWRSVKQRITAKSTADAEFTAISMAADEALWLQRIHDDLRLGDPRIHDDQRLGDQQLDKSSTTGQPILIYNDNEVAIRNCNLEIHQPLSRHVGIRHAWIVDEVALKRIKVVYVPTTDMKADGLTKALGRNLHEKMTVDVRLTSDGRLTNTKFDDASGSAKAFSTFTTSKKDLPFSASNNEFDGVLQLLFDQKSMKNGMKLIVINLDQLPVLPVLRGPV